MYAGQVKKIIYIVLLFCVIIVECSGDRKRKNPFNSGVESRVCQVGRLPYGSFVDAKFQEELLDWNRDNKESAFNDKDPQAIQAIESYLLLNKKNPTLASLDKKHNGRAMIHVATFIDNPTLLLKLIQAGADFDGKDQSGRSPLFIAQKFKKKKSLDILLKIYEELPFTSKKRVFFNLFADRSGLEKNWPVLDALCKNKHNGYRAFAFFLRESYQKNKSHLSFVQKDIFEQVLHYVNSRSEYFPDPVEMLLDKGLNREEILGFGDSVLHFALSRGYKDVVKQCIEAGHDTNLQDENGKTYLHIAMENADYDLVRFLLEHGADKNLQSNDGLRAQDIGNLKLNDAMKITGYESSFQLLSMFTDHRTITSGLNSGLEVIHIAASDGVLQAVVKALEEGVDVNASTKSGIRPIHLAVMNGQCEIVKFLIEKGAQLDVTTSSGISLFDLVMQSLQECRDDFMRARLEYVLDMITLQPSGSDLEIENSMQVEDVSGNQKNNYLNDYSEDLLFKVKELLKYFDKNISQGLLFAQNSVREICTENDINTLGYSGALLEKKSKIIEKKRIKIFYSIERSIENIMGEPVNFDKVFLIDDFVDYLLQRKIDRDQKKQILDVFKREMEQLEGCFANQESHLVLLKAAYASDYSLIETLLDVGVNGNIRDSGDNSAMSIALARGDTVLAELLASRKIGDLVMPYGYNPIQWSLVSKRIESLQWLERKCDNFDQMLVASYPDGGNALHMAIDLGFVEATQYLLNLCEKRQSELHSRNDLNQLPFDKACKKGNKEIIDIFTRYHKRVNDRTAFSLSLYGEELDGD